MVFYDCINHKNAKINQSKYVHRHTHMQTAYHPCGDYVHFKIVVQK